MFSAIVVWLRLSGQFASCAWVPGREMQLAMWRTRWSGVSHYSKLPLDFFATGQGDPFELIDKDTPLENWQQACIIHWNHTEWNSRGMDKEERREWKDNIEEEARDRLKERPWVDPSCDAYSLGLDDACSFYRYDVKPATKYDHEERRKARERTEYITVAESNCFFRGPLTARRPSRRPRRRRFDPTTTTLGATHKPVNIHFRHMMYRCPSTRPLALWVCLKCSSTSLANWILRMEDAALLRRVSHLMDEAITSWPFDGGDATIQALSKVIYEDFPRSFTTREEFGRIANKLAILRSVDGKKKTKDVCLRMPLSYCTLCCAWGDGRLRIVVARNPYVRLMSYYKMKMRASSAAVKLSPSEGTPYFEGWSDFRPWILALLSHRERTGRFTNESLDQFTDDKYKDCTQKDPTCVKSALGEPCALECTDRRPIIPFQDVVHAMPVVDSMLATGYETHVREGLLQIMHLESIESDIKIVEERLCREYGDCEPLPEYPQVYYHPLKNDICHFNAKTPALSNCDVSWEDLWSEPSLVDLVNLHYAEDFRLLGYKTTPFDVMPIRKDS